jgi:hypothetical protein
MNRRLWPLAALALVALIGAGCGSNAGSETDNASSTGVSSATSTGVAGGTGVAGTTSTASKERVTHGDKVASPPSTGLARPARPSPSQTGLPGSAPSAPSPAGRLPAGAPGRPGTRPLSTQSTHEGRTHE